MQHKHRVTMIALGSLVPCLTPVSELAMTSALFIFKVSAHTQRLINDLTQLPVTGIQRYLILWASVSSFVEWDSHFLLTILLWRLREMIYVKHLSLCLEHSITSTNSDNDNNNDIKISYKYYLLYCKPWWLKIWTGYLLSWVYLSFICSHANLMS